MPHSETHFVNGNRLTAPFPEGLEKALFGMGCFWGVERTFWQIPGVYSTAAGYSAGVTENPGYQELCSGMTGHNEVVLVVYDTNKVTYGELLQAFWEGHDPTQGMRQGNDRGSQYRSGIIHTLPGRWLRPKRRGKPSNWPCEMQVWALSRRKYCLRRSFITVKTTTSNIWPRIRGDIVVWEERVSHAR